MFVFEDIAFLHFETIDSTNTWAKEHASELDLEGITCITAHEQTAGRGRQNRNWLSPKDENIYATLFFCIPKEAPYVMNLSQALAIACCRGLKELGFDAKIKWPNDLLIEQKKVGGVLCELTSFKDRIGVVLGVGINVNMPEIVLHAIDQPATSLAALSNKPWPVKQVLHCLLSQFIESLNMLQYKGFSALKESFDELLAFRGENISFHNGDGVFQGKLHSITEDGRLNLELDSGEIKTFSAGDLV